MEARKGRAQEMSPLPRPLSVAKAGNQRLLSNAVAQKDKCRAWKRYAQVPGQDVHAHMQLRTAYRSRGYPRSSGKHRGDVFKRLSNLGESHAYGLKGRSGAHIKCKTQEPLEKGYSGKARYPCL